MPLFQYVALSTEKQEIPGVIEAADTSTAVADLRGQNLFVVEIKPAGSPSDNVSGAGLKRSIWSKLRPVLGRDIIIFFDQTALMLRSGLTLSQALSFSAEQTASARLSRVLSRILTDVQGGASFSAALKSEKRYFPPTAVELIQAAEVSGELDTVLERMARHLEQSLELRNNFLTSLIYPVIVVLMSILVSIFMVVKVIPKFEKFFQARSQNLPPSTQLLLDLSRWVNSYGLYISIGVVTFCAALAAFYINPRGRLIVDRIILSIPVIGDLFKTAAMAHFGRTLAMLLRSGVTLLESLRITAQSIQNAALKRRLNKAAEGMLAGQGFAESIKGSEIPPVVNQVASVGEQTGAIDQVLDEIGVFYERRLQALLKRFTALFEPVIILVLGGIVGFVYYSFFQAVFALAG